MEELKKENTQPSDEPVVADPVVEETSEINDESTEEITDETTETAEETPEEITNEPVIDEENLERRIKLDIIKNLIDSTFPADLLTKELVELKTQIFDNLDNINTTLASIKLESEDLAPEENTEELENKEINVGADTTFEIQNTIGGESIEDIKRKMGCAPANEAIHENEFDRLFKYNLNALAKIADLYFEGLTTKQNLYNAAAKIVNRWDLKNLYECKTDEELHSNLERIITHLKGKMGSIEKV